VGRTEGVIDDRLFVAVMAIALVTSLAAGPMMKWLLSEQVTVAVRSGPASGWRQTEVDGSVLFINDAVSQEAHVLPDVPTFLLRPRRGHESWLATMRSVAVLVMDQPSTVRATASSGGQGTVSWRAAAR
jgi:hypothetical protein